MVDGQKRDSRSNRKGCALYLLYITAVDAGEVCRDQQAARAGLMCCPLLPLLEAAVGWRDLWADGRAVHVCRSFPYTCKALFDCSLIFLSTPREACLTPDVMLWLKPKKTMF